MNYLAKAMGYILTFVAGMAMIVWMQVRMVFPVPETGTESGWWHIHPLYSLVWWAYPAVFVLFVALAAMFALFGRTGEPRRF